VPALFKNLPTQKIFGKKNNGLRGKCERPDAERDSESEHLNAGYQAKKRNERKTPGLGRNRGVIRS